jgi:hypothetical protein
MPILALRDIIHHERNSGFMKSARTFIVLAVLLVLASCASPPQAEIDAARTALEKATRDADVITYAPDALRAAQEKMMEMDTELAAQAKRPSLSRDYDSVKSLAAEAAELGRAAGVEAAAQKQQTAGEAAALVDEVTAAIPAFEQRLWAAKRVPRIKMAIITPLQTLPAQSRAAVADAQNDIASQAYAAARAKLLAVKTQLVAAGETITEQTRIARGR